MTARSELVRLAARLLKPFKLARHPRVRGLYARAYRWMVPEGTRRVSANGVTLCVDPHDRGVGYHLAIGRPYEPASTALFEREARPGACVLDLGANVGYYALLAARLVGPAGRVLAFEPEPANRALLEESKAANGFERLEVFGVACSDVNETVTLRLAHGKGLHTIGDVGGKEEWGRLDVRAVRLDDLLAERLDAGELAPTLVKIDVEGVEPRAVRGMERLLGAAERCALFTEVHPGALGRNGVSVEDYLDQLEALGFAVVSVVDEVAGEDRAAGRAEVEALCKDGPTRVKDWSCNVLLVRAGRPRASEPRAHEPGAGEPRARAPRAGGPGAR